MRVVAISLIFSLLLATSCGSGTSLGLGAKNEPESNSVAAENYAPPFLSKEPEKFQAKIVFSFKFDESATNFNQQTTLIARDGLNRRLDFENAGKITTFLQTSEGKSFVMLPKQKVYAERAVFSDVNALNSSENNFELSNLLNIRPEGAAFEKIGTEDIGSKSLIKYRVNFGTVKEAENSRTETFIWMDEQTGLPFKTEISALINGRPNGAISTIELQDFKTDVEPQVFSVPADYRKISQQEIQEIIKPK